MLCGVVIFLLISTPSSCRSLIARLTTVEFPFKDSAYVDTSEFAPGYPSPELNAVEQLKAAPDPRYRLGHTMRPNILWMSPRYFGGMGQDLPVKQVISNSKYIMLELAQRMNYALVLPGNTYGVSGYNDTNAVTGAYVGLANKHPELPASLILFWGQINTSACHDKMKKGPAIFRGNFPDSYYLSAGKRRLTPAAPADSFRQDGVTMSCYLQRLCDNLKRPVDLINENGEVFKLFGEKQLKDDPNVLADKEKTGIADWDEYEATRRLEKEKAFQSGFLEMPCLKNAVYTEYGIDGHRTYRHKYSVVRKVNTPINGQYYSTPDFYPRWADNWKEWKGAWHGFKWIADCRAVETKLGDEFYSPFVSAGWDHREEKNIRPAQWLALLKALGVTGAEFYYAGFFSLEKPYPKPENYAWQALIPAYAQAVTSRYEELLRNSMLIGFPSLNLSKVEDELVVARKKKDAEVYIISGSIQRTSRSAPAATSERITEVKLGSHVLKLKIRTQGSTYIFDASGNTPVFYQLDEWHENKHPLRWRTSMSIDAELADNIDRKRIITEKQSSEEGDYSSFTSYVALDDPTKFTIRPNPGMQKTFVYALVRSKSADATIKMNGNSTSVRDLKSWRWQPLGELIISGKEQTLTLQGKNIELDKIIVTADPHYKFSNR
jgi:hypothetical protein